MRRATLTREEIAHLLHGHAAGKTGLVADDPQAGNPLELLHWPHGSQPPTDAGASRNDTCVRPMQDRWDRVAELLSQELSGCFQQTVAVDLQRSERTTSGKFLLGCDKPAILLGVETEDTGRPVWLSIELPLVFSFLDRLLGGELRPHQGPCRELTDLEKRLAMRIVQPCLSAIQAGWPEIHPGQPSPQSIRERPEQVLQSEKCDVAASGMTLRVADVRGTLSMAVPWEDALRACVADPPSGDSAAERPARLATLSVIVARARIPESDLRNLEVGDLIPTERRHDQPVQVAIDGQIRFLAQAGEIDGRKAIRIE